MYIKKINDGDLEHIHYYKDPECTILHREDGPACESFENKVLWIQEWWLNGKRHREVSPAIVYTNGRREWWLNGKRHRKNAPAIINNNGTEYWYFNGEHHRIDGPAITYYDGEKEYWLYNKLLPNKQSFLNEINKLISCPAKKSKILKKASQ